MTPAAAARALRWLGPVLLVPVAFAVGVAGAFVHGRRGEVAGVGVPWGLLFAAGATAALFALVRAATPARWVVGLAVVGWAAGVVPLTLQRPEGDLVVTGRWSGLAFLLLGVAAAGVALVLPPAARERAPGSGSDSMGTPLDR